MDELHTTLTRSSFKRSNHYFKYCRGCLVLRVPRCGLLECRGAGEDFFRSVSTKPSSPKKSGHANRGAVVVQQAALPAPAAVHEKSASASDRIVHWPRTLLHLRQPSSWSTVPRLTSSSTATASTSGTGRRRRELVGLPDVETFCQLPWDPKTARVFCTLFREPGRGSRPGQLPDLRLPRQPAPDPRGVRG